MRNEEISIDFLSDAILFYSPNGGTVIDSYAGTLTAGILTLICGRKSVLIEEDKECLDLYIQILKDYAVEDSSRASVKKVGGGKRIVALRSQTDESFNTFVSEEMIGTGQEILLEDVSYQREMDHKSLSDYEEEGRCLIAMSKVSNKEDFKQLPFPYKCPGKEIWAIYTPAVLIYGMLKVWNPLMVGN